MSCPGGNTDEYLAPREPPCTCYLAKWNSYVIPGFRHSSSSLSSSLNPRGSLEHQRWFHNQFPPFFPVLHCPLGLGELQACPFPDVVFPPLSLSALSSSPFHCALQDGFGQTWWTGNMTIPLQFASFYDRQEIFMWSNCLLDLQNSQLLTAAHKMTAQLDVVRTASEATIANQSPNHNYVWGLQDPRLNSNTNQRLLPSQCMPTNSSCQNTKCKPWEDRVTSYCYPASLYPERLCVFQCPTTFESGHTAFSVLHTKSGALSTPPRTNFVVQSNVQWGLKMDNDLERSHCCILRPKKKEWYRNMTKCYTTHS